MPMEWQETQNSMRLVWCMVTDATLANTMPAAKIPAKIAVLAEKISCFKVATVWRLPRAANNEETW